MAMDDIDNLETKPLHHNSPHSGDRGHLVRRKRKRKRKPQDIKQRSAKINPIHLLILVALALTISFFIVTHPFSDTTPSSNSSDAAGP
jgi:hypothetical protein